MANEIDLNSLNKGTNVIEVLQLDKEDYNELRNKPLINGVELKGDKSSSDLGIVTNEEVEAGLSTKQDTLVSGTNIKTVNNISLLGAGDISLQTEAVWGNITGTLSDQTDLKNALDAKANSADLGTMATESASAYTKTSGLATVATTGDYDDLINKPTIPAAQVNSDWNAESGVAQILNKPTIPEGLPSQTGQSGKFLTTNGTTASWATVQVSGAPTLTWYTGNTGTIVTIADTSSANLVKIYKNGLLLQPTEDYAISGTTLTMVTALFATDKITVEVF